MIFYLLLFIFGAIVGSFVNVLSLRYSPERNVFDPRVIGGRSRCPRCGKQLEARELVPIFSFLFQRGRCRSCRAPISWQYPIVEFLCGVIFVAVPLFLNKFFGVSASAFFNLAAPKLQYALAVLWIFVFLTWLLIFLIDLKHYIIPDELNATLIFLGVLFVIMLAANPVYFGNFRDSFLRHYNILFAPFESFVWNHVLGGAIGLVFFGGFSLITLGKAMGMGDAKLALPSGLLLGFADIGLAIAIAFIFGGIAGAALLFKKKKTMRDKVPFAPFLVLGFALTFFFGADIVAGYFALFPLV